MTIHRTVLKQKNKPFKNSKSKKKGKVQKVVTEKVAVVLKRKARKHQILSKKKKLRAQLQEESPRNVLVLPFHLNAKPIEFIKAVLHYHSPELLKNHHESKDGWFISHPILLPSNVAHDGMARRLLFYTCPRTLDDILLAAAAADIIICLFRGSTDTEPAFDEYGYRVLSALRLQGLSAPVGVNLEAGLPGDRQASSTLVRRYFHSEFGNERKFTSVFTESDLRQVFTSLSVISIPQLSWRKDRGYMFSVNYGYDELKRELFIEGYAKGLGFSIHHPVHVTSMGDFLLNKIELLSDICPVRSSHNMSFERVLEVLTDEIARALVSEVDCLNDDLHPVQEAESSKDVTEDLFDSLTNLKINRIMYTGEEEEEDEDMNSEENEESDFDEEGNSDEEDYLTEELCTNEAKKIEFEKRALEDLSFPDEVDTPVDVLASDRFKKYRALKNIRSSMWDPYESLPQEYIRINEFQNYRLTMKESIKTLRRNCGLSNTTGSYIRITLSNVSPSDYNKIVSMDGFERPLIVSTVLPYERKVSVLNFSANRTSEGPDSLPSKTLVSFYCGFRRFPGRPIFSRDINVVRGKRGIYERFFHRGHNCIGSIYFMALAQPTPVIALDPNDETVLFGGHVTAADPSRIILKRIVLTGYPVRVHRKRAVVRYMFFNPSDIKYFKPAQLYTKRGLRGKILSSLGTHGYMKCLFSDYIHPNDIVCLALYKRVYPKWFTDSWTKWL